jgi:hypothetical protein
MFHLLCPHHHFKKQAAQRTAHQPPPVETADETGKDTLKNETGNTSNLDHAVGCMRLLGGAI